jgi:hypothetical protein
LRQRPRHRVAGRPPAAGEGDRTWTIEPPQPAEFLATVCLGPQLDRLPVELRESYINAILAPEPKPFQLEYVRLNIEARVPPNGSAVPYP